MESRESIIDPLHLVKAALGKGDFVPVLSHFCFADGAVYAYNDVLALKTECPLELEAAVPGSLLLNLLSSIPDEEINVELNDHTLHINTNKSKFDLQTLSTQAFIYEEPDEKPLASFKVDGAFLNALSSCLMSVGNDSSKPQTMGITLKTKGNTGYMYSTDNVTMSRAEVTIKADGDLPAEIILPATFCTELINITDYQGLEDTQMDIGEDYVFVNVSDVTSIYCKTIQVEESFAFDEIFKQLIADTENLGDQKIPDDLLQALKRAQYMLESETERRISFELEDNTVCVDVDSALGQSDEEIVFEKPVTEELMQFDVDPKYMIRATTNCVKMAFTPNVVIFTNGLHFFHAVTHYED